MRSRVTLNAVEEVGGPNEARRSDVVVAEWAHLQVKVKSVCGLTLRGARILPLPLPEIILLLPQPTTDCIDLPNSCLY